MQPIAPYRPPALSPHPLKKKLKWLVGVIALLCLKLYSALFVPESSAQIPAAKTFANEPLKPACPPLVTKAETKSLDGVMSYVECDGKLEWFSDSANIHVVTETAEEAYRQMGIRLRSRYPTFDFICLDAGHINSQTAEFVSGNYKVTMSVCGVPTDFEEGSFVYRLWPAAVFAQSQLDSLKHRGQ